MNDAEAIMSFGINLCYYRKKMKITQEELAERLDVTRQTISRWETDTALPDVETLIRLCDLFDCNMDTLVRGNAESFDANKKMFPKAYPYLNDLDLKRIQRNGLLKSKIDTISDAVIASVAIIVFLVLGLGFGLWHPAWVAFPVAAVLCFIIQAITSLTLTAPYFNIKFNKNTKKGS